MYNFYNLYPFFNMTFDDAIKKCLNYDRHYAFDHSYLEFENTLTPEIVQYCKKNSELIKDLAIFNHLENNFKYNPKIMNEPLTSNPKGHFLLLLIIFYDFTSKHIIKMF